MREILSYRRLVVPLALGVSCAFVPAAIPAGQASPSCSRVVALGMAKQMNLRAASVLARCDRTRPKRTATGPTAAPSPGDYGGPDRDVIAGGEGVWPHVTQSQSQSWAHGATVVVTYNDSRTAPACFSGGSYSLDDGATWTNLDSRPFCSGHGDGFGDPTVVYNERLAQWFASFITGGGDCDEQGIGVWRSGDGIAWTPAPCAHAGLGDDRHSLWVDNNPQSPFYGRMYISWNDFDQEEQIRVSHSDDGVAWSAPVDVTAEFIRNVQITVAPSGDVFIAGLDEGAGGFDPRTNLMYRSTDGGASWVPLAMGPSFPAPGDSICDDEYYARINPIWRFMGAGDVGVGPDSVVHYVFGEHGAGADPGDIYYTRSSDNGATWDPPIRIDGDSGPRAQWLPSLSVTSEGRVFISWYDRRGTTTDSYERWGTLSTDNGQSFAPALPLSDGVIPQPQQPDPEVVECYAGDFDRSFALGSSVYSTWTDGRVEVGGQPQQNVFFDRVDTDVEPQPAPRLVHDLTTIEDEDGDGVLQPGESFHLTERVRNVGNDSAGGVTAVLTSSSAGLTITQGSSAYPDVPPGERGENSTPFAGVVSDTATCGTSLAANLALTSGARSFAVGLEIRVPCYTIASSTGHAIVPGTTDVGNHCDDCTTLVTFPFPIRLYGQQYTSGVVSSNGNLQLGTSFALYPSCLPSEDVGPSIMPYWDDLKTDGPGGGIFAATLGAAPNRRFVLEWRASYFEREGNANFEIVFSEGSGRISTVYGATADSGAEEVAGIQKSASGPAEQFSCATPSLVEGLQVDYLPVNRAPQASFTYSPTGPDTGEPVTFTSTSTDADGSIAELAWDFDADGEFDDATGMTATRSFPRPGRYDVSLRATDDVGRPSVALRSVTVANRRPRASFTHTPASPRADQTVVFTSTSTDPDGTLASQRWDLDADGAFDDATGPTASRSFPAARTYVVSLRVTDDAGAASDASDSIVVAARRGSRGTCRVPNVRGRTLGAARQEISRAGCRTGRVQRARSAIRRGRVVSQRPRAGVRRSRGTRVNLVVSRGRR